MRRTFHTFHHKNANFRIASDRPDLVEEAIVFFRAELDAYVASNEGFADSLVPLPIGGSAPSSVQAMLAAGLACSVGPMAAVAGTMAEFSARRAIQAGASEVIIDNGGDIFVDAAAPVVLGIYAGNNPLSGNVAFRLEEAHLPIAVCSSSSEMGHSLSFGCCDLVTVFSKNAALADAAATSICNQIKEETDIHREVNNAAAIDGILGVFAVKNETVGMAGRLPELIKCSGPIDAIITADPDSPDLGMIRGLQ